MDSVWVARTALEGSVLFSEVLISIHEDEKIRLPPTAYEFSFLEDVHLMKGRNFYKYKYSEEKRWVHSRSLQHFEVSRAAW